MSLANDERRMQLAANALGAGEKVVWVGQYVSLSHSYTLNCSSSLIYCCLGYRTACLAVYVEKI